MRYEKKSTILTTNINFNAWDNIFYDPVVTNAILDRILHHAHVIPTNGKSYRLKDYFLELSLNFPISFFALFIASVVFELNNSK